MFKSTITKWTIDYNVIADYLTKQIKELKYEDAGDRTRGLLHAKRTLYH